MNIELNDKQYEALLELVYYGNHVANDYNENRNKNYDELEQLLMTNAKNTPIAKDMFFDNKENTMQYKQKKEDKLFDQIDDYNKNVFFDEIVNHFAIKELNKKYSVDKLEKLNDEQYESLIIEIKDKYYEELEDNGLNGLSLRTR